MGDAAGVSAVAIPVVGDTVRSAATVNEGLVAGADQPLGAVGFQEYVPGGKMTLIVAAAPETVAAANCDHATGSVPLLIDSGIVSPSLGGAVQLAPVQLTVRVIDAWLMLNAFDSVFPASESATTRVVVAALAKGAPD